MNNEEFDYTDSQMLRKKAEKILKKYTLLYDFAPNG